MAEYKSFDVITITRPTDVEPNDWDAAETVLGSAMVAELNSQLAKKKSAMPEPVINLLKAYIASEDASLMVRSPFGVIISFFDIGAPLNRLTDACTDFGYTLNEMWQLNENGATALDIAQEIIDR